ncbi:MAG: TolC family protein [Muribaculaceae bacterium]|nr:TolC family protein [Muribaculaceae bacterium]
MSRHIIFAGLVVSILCSACSGVKNLRQPETETPAAFTARFETDSACLADVDWWQFYSDSTLCRFIRRTLENNRDLLAAAARIEEMRSLYGVAKANMLPTIDGRVYAQDETNDYSGTGITHDREIGIKVPISWEINLLGSLSWAKKRGEANYLATAEDYRAMQVSLIAQTAEAYFRLVALENELSIVRRTVESRKESLRMAKLRFEGGLTSETVYQQAMVEYSTAASLIPSLEKQLTAARNALTLLMGEFPDEELSSGKHQLDPMKIEQLPVGVPSTLLQRRPDLRASELRLKAAMANAGLTYADRFPTLQLGFTPGLENNELTCFLKSPFTFIVASVSGPVFDFGRRKRKYEAAVAAYEQSRLQYEKNIIQAFTEVNMAINAYQDACRTSRLKQNLRDAAAEYERLANLQYLGGSLRYIDVLDAQRRYFDARIDVSNSIRDEYFALIALYKALGGGWSLPE